MRPWNKSEPVHFDTEVTEFAEDTEVFHNHERRALGELCDLHVKSGIGHAAWHSPMAALCSKTAQKPDHRRVHLGSFFLLCPVTAIREPDRMTRVRNETRQIGD
jgi:hypothetical protein